MTIDLSNLNILVTGASRGIGRAICKQLAISGARLAIHYNQQSDEANKLAREVGNKSIAFKADLTHPKDAIQLYNDVIEEFGHLDVLINNAGIALSTEIDTDDLVWIAAWRQTMQVNLEACALLTKKIIPQFISRGGGIIINIASRAAFRGDTSDYLAYAASKGGMVAFTRSIARAYGKQNIKAFTIAPGFVRTDMAQEFMDQYGESYALDDIALSQLTQPQDLAPIITLLASGMADHATGCTIDVNAGSYVH